MYIPSTKMFFCQNLPEFNPILPAVLTCGILFWCVLLYCSFEMWNKRLLTRESRHKFNVTVYEKWSHVEFDFDLIFWVFFSWHFISEIQIIVFSSVLYELFKYYCFSLLNGITCFFERVSLNTNLVKIKYHTLPIRILS